MYKILLRTARGVRVDGDNIKVAVEVGMDLSGSGQTHVNTAGATKVWKYLYQLSNYQLLKWCKTNK